MMRLYLSLAVAIIAFASCQKDVEVNITPKPQVSVETTSTRSYDEALKVAEDAIEILEGKNTRSAKKRIIKRSEGQTVIRPVTRGSEATEEPIMYVFNYENDEGFAIVAADRSQQPLIAVTEQGNYTYGEPTGVEPFDILIEEVATTLSFGPPATPTPKPNTPLDPRPAHYVDTVDIFTRVDPLLTTKWGQYDIYNDLCYNKQSQECPAGCVATALAQILAYNRHPTQMQITFEGDYYGDILYLDWTNILKHTCYSFIHTECASEHNNISILFREIGERVDMEYTLDGSSAYTTNALNFLKQVGFTSAKISDGMSYALTKLNLREGKPVYMRGECYDTTDNSYKGHAWVVDGVHDREYGTQTYELNPNYDPSIIYNNPEPEYFITDSNIQIERMLHFNWGYNGTCNGWFSTDNICMIEAVEYDDSPGNSDYDRDYKYLMRIIYDISIW